MRARGRDGVTHSITRPTEPITAPPRHSAGLGAPMLRSDIQQREFAVRLLAPFRRRRTELLPSTPLTRRSAASPERPLPPAQQPSSNLSPISACLGAQLRTALPPPTPKRSQSVTYTAVHKPYTSLVVVLRSLRGPACTLHDLISQYLHPGTRKYTTTRISVVPGRFHN